MSQYPHNRSFTAVSEAEMVCATRAPERYYTRPSKRELQKLLAMERYKGGKRRLVQESRSIPRESTGRLPKTDGTGVPHKMTARTSRHANAEPKH